VSVSQIVSYEIEVQAESGWRAREAFSASELAEARAAWATLEANPPAASCRLVEERLTEQGMYVRRTLAYRRAVKGTTGRPADPAAKPVSVARRQPPVVAPAPAPGRAIRRPAATARRPAPPAGTAAKSGRAGFSLVDLLSFLLVPNRAGAADPMPDQVPAAPVPTRRRGDLEIFDDELTVPTLDVVVGDVTTRQFQSFVEALGRTGLLPEAARKPDFGRQMALFVVGVLFSIEESLDLNTDRGRAITVNALSLVLDSHDSINHFMGALPRYLTATDAPPRIKAGSRCYRLYRDLDVVGMERSFAEAFGLIEPIREGPDGRVRVGVLFTDIVDSTRMTEELGDAVAQLVVDHHDEMVSNFCRRYGGRKVKHLGDGFMLGFGNVESMIGCALAVIDAMRAVAHQVEIPPYRIRCGGHFGDAIQKNGDYFGSTVQLAARIAAAASDNEARFCTQILESEKPLFDRLTPRGTAELKGFEHPVALVGYA